MKTKGKINLVEIRKQEMQETFSDHIDFSDTGFLITVNPEILAKEKKVSRQERYEIALSSLRKITGLSEPEEIISTLEDKEVNTPDERKHLRFLKKFH